MMASVTSPFKDDDNNNACKRQHKHRVVLHFDVDAFYVACEREFRPELRGKPLGVSQYNPYGDLRDMPIDDPTRLVIQPARTKREEQNKDTDGPVRDVDVGDVTGDGNKDEQISTSKLPTTNSVNTIPPSANNNAKNNNGSLIAVSYEARAQNVKRNDRGRDAVKKCPGLYVMQVPVKHGKADLTIYRRASQRVMTQLTEGMVQAAKDIYDLITKAGDMKEKQENQGTATISNDKNKRPKELSQIMVEKASIDEVYIEVSSPVNVLLLALDELQANENDKRPSSLFQQVIKDYASLTIIGGMETNEAGLANNALTKDDLRRGSSLQVLDSKQSSMDTGSLSWWNRSHEEWANDEMALAMGAALSAKARAFTGETFQSVYTLSGGISSNKVMAKLASGLKKPNRQTLINPQDESALQKLFYPLPLGRIRGLGGKFGDHVESLLNVSTVGELARLPKTTLHQHFAPEQAEMLYRMAQGICDEPVEDRTKTKSIGASKTFRNQLCLKVAGDDANLHKWMAELASEVDERLELDYMDHHRHASLLTINLLLNANQGVSMRGSSSMSKSTALSYASGVKEDHGDTAFRLAKDLLSSVQRTDQDGKPRTIVSMAVAASNFIPIAKGTQSIVESFQKAANSHSGNISTMKKRPRPQQFDLTEASPLPKHRDLASEDATTVHAFREAKSDAVVSTSSAVDNDIAYARQLQESYDKENELWSRLEQRKTTPLSSSSSGKKRPKKQNPPSGSSKISSFFRPKAG
jgi:nucleotidyltransferase/DNA polymerase involved in DNA repair